MLAKLVVWLLKNTSSEKDRAFLVNAVINTLDAVPVRAIISADEYRRVLVNGRQLEPEQIISLRESAANALNNHALNLVREEVRWKAINLGYLQALDPTKTSEFYKAALWYAQEEKDLLRRLADHDSTV